MSGFGRNYLAPLFLPRRESRNYEGCRGWGVVKVEREEGNGITLSLACRLSHHGMLKYAREEKGRKEEVMSLGRILVVDDEAEVRRSVRLVLTKAGYDVREAEDGDQAISLIRSNDNPFKVSLIICDIHMPKVDGMEAVAYFRQEFPSVPVIVFTGKPELAGATHLFKQGIVDYLEKPVSPEKLIQAVRSWVKDNAFEGSN